MKKTLLFFVVSVASLLTLLLTGCSKKDSGSGSYNMKTVAGTYKLTASTVTVNGVTSDYMPNIPACEKDDIMQLNSDSTYIYTDAGTTCATNGSGSGQWFISGSFFVQDGDTLNIKSFNGSALVLTLTESQGGITGTSTTTLTKQ